MLDKRVTFLFKYDDSDEGSSAHQLTYGEPGETQVVSRVDALPHGESGSVAADQSASIGVEKDVKDNPPPSSKKGKEVFKKAGCKKRKKPKDLIDDAKETLRESEIAIDEVFKDKICV